jgi:hypothetical protein
MIEQSRKYWEIETHQKARFGAIMSCSVEAGC